MRNRNCWIWIAFACCACLVAAAMMWLTRSAIYAERERNFAEIRAELQERVRLSLWRMDSLGASILLEENAIPVQFFLNEPKTSLPDLARFESPDGAAIRGTGNPDFLNKCTAMLPGIVTTWGSSGATNKKDEASDSDELKKVSDNYVTPSKSKISGGIEMQQLANEAEMTNRKRLFGQALSKQQNSTYGSLPAPQDERSGQAAANPNPTPSSDKQASNPIGDFKPQWFDDSLFLMRRGMTQVNFSQGTLVDQEKLKELLLTEAKQDLPNAELIKVEDKLGDSLNLASFPFRLVPGSIGLTIGSIPETISISLLVGWLAVLTALLAAYFLISNVMKLSERRASFVSAVTHELRTPLTTFRLYSDMLSSNAVPEKKRPVYLSVLSREADRLSHLVENVLAFSQVERGSARSKVSEAELNSLLESFRERFATRLEAAGLKLKLDLSDPITAKIDASLLEHILFNLIDNAAKYAGNSDPAEVSLTVEAGKHEIKITVADYGPGISNQECRKIFRPFHKSAEQAAETKPGVGLGLALSRRLARAMGGSLSFNQRSDGKAGAIFTLKLPKNL